MAEFVPANSVWASCNDRLDVIEAFLVDLFLHLDDPSVDVTKLKAAVAPLDDQAKAMAGLRPTPQQTG